MDGIGRTMKLKLALLALCAAIVYGADRLVGVVCQSSGLANQLVDIQQPAMLLAKLDCLRRFPGRKVALLGDSLVYGGILEDFGDRQWREHNLAAAIDQRCRERWPDEEVLVMNLGINGALPCDLEKLAPLVTACGVDCIVVDVHLRPFSRDFASTATRMARPWLDEISLDSHAVPHWRPCATPAPFDAQPAITSWLVDASALFRHRQLLQESILQSSLAKRLKTWRRPVAAQSQNDLDMQGWVKLGQLKQRLKNVTLDADNPQVTALQRLLSQLSQANQPYVVFYAKENPDLLYDVFDKERHDELYAELTRLIAGQTADEGVFLPPVDELQPDHFLDFTHLNVEGYQILARHVVEAFSADASKRASIAQVEQNRPVEYNRGRSPGPRR